MSDHDARRERWALAIHEKCRTEGTSIVHDDPRNIAEVVMAIADAERHQDERFKTDDEPTTGGNDPNRLLGGTESTNPAPAAQSYPYPDGDVIVLGPEVFVSNDGDVICWKGENYTRQTPAETTPDTDRSQP